MSNVIDFVLAQGPLTIPRISTGAARLAQYQ